MPATNQRSNPPRGSRGGKTFATGNGGPKSRLSRGRGRARNSKKGYSGAGHAPSAKTHGRMHTAKKGDYGRQTGLYASSGAGPFTQATRGPGMKGRARGKHRFITKQGARRSGEVGMGGM